MTAQEPTVQVKAISEPDEIATVLDGSARGSVQLLHAMRVGHGTNQPGWRWSEHAGPLTGLDSQRHFGNVISGHMVLRGRDGAEVEVGPGEAFAASEGR